MRKPRHQPNHDRKTKPFGQLERLTGHVVCVLLVARLKHGYLGKITVETRILLVLRGMHAGVVGNREHQTPVGAG